MARTLLVAGLLIGACAPSAASVDDAREDSPPASTTAAAPSAPASAPIEAPPPTPAPAPGPAPADDGGAADAWPRYVISAGSHAAAVVAGAAGNPRAGFVGGIGSRAYDLAFDSSAAYTITNPTQPNDQLDWNKLPGLSDCGTFDLARDGVMFGWRWRLDLTPNVLEVTGYANNDRVHLTAPAALVVLDAADLASISPLRYELEMDGAKYRFAITGVVRGRTIAVASELPRRCAATKPSSLVVQWAAGLYFGGTSTAPTTITARIFEHWN